MLRVQKIITYRVVHCISALNPSLYQACTHIAKTYLLGPSMPDAWQVWDITLGMLAEKAFKGKGAEIRGLVGFLNRILQKYKSTLIDENPDPDSQLCFRLMSASMEAALKFEELLKSNTRGISQETAHAMFNEYDTFIKLAERAGMPLTPKSHLVYHMIQRAVEKGNPRTYSTYRDESLNGSVNQLSFSIAVLRKVHVMERIAFQKALKNVVRLKELELQG